MVALKTYKPNNLSINPFQIGQELAKTYDYDGVLDQIGKWNALGNAESVADLNEVRAQKEQESFDLDQKRKEAVEAQIESGIDPLKIDYGEINRSIGDFEGVIKAEAAKAAKAAERDKQYLPELARASKLIQDNPAMKNDIVARLQAQGIQVAPQQFANKGSGDKPDKPPKPKMQLWTDGKETRDVNVNDPVAVMNATKDKFFNLKDFDLADQMGLTKKPEEEPKDTRGFFSRMNGDAPKIVGPSPENPSSQPPPGYEFTGKVVGNRKGIRKIQ